MTSKHSRKFDYIETTRESLIFQLHFWIIASQGYSVIPYDELSNRLKIYKFIEEVSNNLRIDYK